VSANFYYTLGASKYSTAYAVEIDRVNSRLFVSGKYDVGSSLFSLFAAFQTNGTQLWGKQKDPSTTFVAHYLAYYESIDPTNNKLYACGENNLDMNILRVNLPAYTASSPYLSSNAPTSSDFEL
jgi:hypothetical protein